MKETPIEWTQATPFCPPPSLLTLTGEEAAEIAKVCTQVSPVPHSVCLAFLPVCSISFWSAFLDSPLAFFLSKDTLCLSRLFELLLCSLLRLVGK